MIANSASKIYRAYRAARRGNMRSATEILVGSRTYRKDGKDYKPNTLASNWLELQYGWLPLLKDAVAGAEFLSHHFTVPQQMKFRVSAKHTIGTFLNANPVRYDYIEKEVLYRKSIICTLKEKDVYQLAGLTDPLSVAWELIPYSFVIDWFIPIGNYLQNRGLASALEGKFVTTTKLVRKVKGAVIKGGYDVYPPERLTTYVAPHWEYISLRREVNTSLQVPTPKVIGLQEAFSWKRAANAVSLLLTLQSLTPSVEGAKRR